jgi:histidinol-phosphatase (PHP family)
MQIDSHMHTPLCGHAIGEPIEYARCAAEKGIDVITFTCHIPMQWEAFGQAGTRMRYDQIEEYRNKVHAAAEEASSFGVEVLCGIEAEVFPDEKHMQAMDEILDGYPWDFVLGSLHAHCRSYLDWLSDHGATGNHERINHYFRHLREGVLSGRYDSMSHPDVIRTYGVVKKFEPSEHEAVIVDFLQAVVDRDICMEVNTSGLVKGDFEVHPDPLILDWASELGVKLTIGSDSHKPDTVGRFFDTVQAMLLEKGFKHLHFFRGRKRERINIPE